jgi:hypothetical protein
MKLAPALALGLVLAVAPARAGTPTLEKVATPKETPLLLSAPAGWEVRIEPPRHKDLSTIATISPRCPSADISVTIQLDQRWKKPAQLLKDQYGKPVSTRLHGWDCVLRDTNTEVMCAGTLRGLRGVVGVYFATTDEAAYRRFGDPAQFTSQIADSLAWLGKLGDLKPWTRERTDAAATACK